MVVSGVQMYVHFQPRMEILNAHVSVASFSTADRRRKAERTGTQSVAGLGIGVETRVTYYRGSTFWPYEAIVVTDGASQVRTSLLNVARKIDSFDKILRHRRRTRPRDGSSGKAHSVLLRPSRALQVRGLSKYHIPTIDTDHDVDHLDHLDQLYHLYLVPLLSPAVVRRYAGSICVHAANPAQETCARYPTAWCWLHGPTLQHELDNTDHTISGTDDPSALKYLDHQTVGIECLYLSKAWSITVGALLSWHAWSPYDTLRYPTVVRTL